MSGGVTKEMMDGLPVFAKSIISEQDKEIASLKEKVKELEKIIHDSYCHAEMDAAQFVVNNQAAQIAVLTAGLEFYANPNSYKTVDALAREQIPWKVAREALSSYDEKSK